MNTVIASPNDAVPPHLSHFHTRRFSRTSNDDEPPAIHPPISHPNIAGYIHIDDPTGNNFPTLEEEESSLFSADRELVVAPNQQLQIGIEADQHRRDFPLHQGTQEHVALQRVREHALLDLVDDQAAQEQYSSRNAREHPSQANNDARSSSSQDVVIGLRSPASSISSSIPPAQDGPLDFTLPEDDGMSAMRARIVRIQDAPLSGEEKARQMLLLMTERYTVSQASLQSPQLLRILSQSSPASSGVADSNISIEILNLDSSPRASPSPTHDNNVVKRIDLTPEDCQPTYYRRTRRPSDGHGSSGRGLENSTEDSEEDPIPYGCPHYKRNIKLQCSTCRRWYTCRFCHDAVEDHKLIRRETKNMLCMFCSCPQAASGICVECGQSAAWYYCDVCKLWDDTPSRSIYHCTDCGICRVGEGIGKDFYHCKTCGVCLEISIAESHRCIERSTDCDCPICGDYMFTSPEKVVFMRCGHSIHDKCYQEHIRQSYRCPICSRTVRNMEAEFNGLKRMIEAQPMPQHLRDTKAWIYCNDCSAKTTVKYHWLGCACDICDSFNTAMLQLLKISDADIGSTLEQNEETFAGPSTTVPIYQSRPVSRGRNSLPIGQTLRNSASISAIEAAISTQPLHASVAGRNIRSASPTLQRQTPTMESSDSSDSDETDLEEVTFWGGSPSPPGEGLSSPSWFGVGNSVNNQDDSDPSGSSEEISDAELDDVSDESGSDDMDLLGHV